MKLPINTTLYGGRYQITRCIGNGGFGITYLAWDNQLRREVVLKEYFPQFMVRRDTTYSPEVFTLDETYHFEFHKGIERFLSEAQTLAKLNDIPEIADVHDIFAENNTAYIVMEFIKGKNLKQCIMERTYPYTFDEAIDLLRPCLVALQRVHHAGLIHRDFTPDNIILTDNGTPKIIDFGSSREFVGNEATMTIMVKHGYAPVEQYSSRVKQGAYTDVYSISAIIYEMLTLHKPVSAIERTVNDPIEPISMYNQMVTPAQEAVVMKGLSVDWRGRYQEICNLLADCTQVSTKQVANASYNQNMVTTASGNETFILNDNTEKIDKKKSKKANKENESYRNNDTLLINGNTNKKKKMKGKTKFLIALILIMIMSVFGTVMFFKLQPQVVNINDYIEFEADGYNALGEGKFEINYKKMAKDCEKLEFTSKAQDEKRREIKSKTPAEYITEYITIVPDIENNLSNGQEIHYTIEVDEEVYDYVKCKIVAEPGIEKVKGLKEIENFNPFGDLSIDYEGEDGKAKAILNYTGSELTVYDFQCDKNENLKNGDVITVEISEEVVNKCVEKLNMVPAPVKIELTVEGLTHRLVRGDEMTEETLNEMKAQADDIISQYISTHRADSGYETFNGTEYLGYYILSSKDSEAWDAATYFYLIYKTSVNDVYGNEGDERYINENTDFYWYVKYTNPMVREDGSVDVNVLEYETPGDRIEVQNPYSWSWYYWGYATQDDIYKVIIESNKEKFNHEESF